MVLLAVAVILLYGQTAGHDFVNYDDPFYVTANDYVREGLSGENVRWALSAFYYSNWHPLTWLSHMADVSAFGMNPGAHHLVSAGMHLLSSLLLVSSLAALTGALLPSLLTALLFAFHPLHVESVAWIAERKDVLAGLLFLAALRAWAVYVRRPGWAAYLATALLFALSLSAKAMTVTFPLVLLLLDRWPLGRLSRRTLVPLMAEKVPLLLLSLAGGITAWLAQRWGGSVASLDTFGFPLRAANAVASLGRYLAKTVWPAGLSVYYPHPGEAISPWGVAGAATILLLLTLAALRWRGLGYPLIGWLWFMVMILPVSGLVQLEAQAMADRYTYLPLIGPFLAVAWLLRDLARGARVRRRWVAAAAMGATVLLGAAAFVQVGHWRSSLTLFAHALAVDDRNWVAHNQYATALMAVGRIPEAIPHLGTASRLNPLHKSEIRFRTGYALARQGRTAEALEEYREAIRRLPPGMEHKAAVIRREMELLLPEGTARP
jgi:hypothetical protein